MIVIDTSVALKWVLPEPGTGLAKDALRLALIAPDLWRVDDRFRRVVVEKSDLAFRIVMLPDLFP